MLTSNTKRTALVNRFVVVIVVEEEPVKAELLEVAFVKNILALITPRSYIGTGVGSHSSLLATIVHDSAQIFKERRGVS